MTAAGRLAMVGLGAIGLASCAPRIRPATGVVVMRALPATVLPPGYRQVVFRWTLVDEDLESRGDGAARLAAPDSARVDFFLAGGMGGGAAVLIGPELRLGSTADRFVARLAPPAALLWGAFGRVSVPAMADTTLRVDGDTLRADIGTPVAWRLTFANDTLRRVERVHGGRVVETVERFADGHVRYRHAEARRRLELMVTRSTNASPFHASIWVLP